VREQELVMPAACVAARAVAARCGEAREEPAGAGKAAAQTLVRHVVRGKAAHGRRVHSTWPARAAGAAQRRNRGAGAGGR
jgi:hypothetical protein